VGAEINQAAGRIGPAGRQLVIAAVEDKHLLAAMNTISNDSKCLFISAFIICTDMRTVWRYNSCTEQFINLSVYV
jgi:hypothetical protein